MKFERGISIHESAQPSLVTSSITIEDSMTLLQKSINESILAYGLIQVYGSKSEKKQTKKLMRIAFRKKAQRRISELAKAQRLLVNVCDGSLNGFCLEAVEEVAYFLTVHKQSVVENIVHESKYLFNDKPIDREALMIAEILVVVESSVFDPLTKEIRCYPDETAF